LRNALRPAERSTTLALIALLALAFLVRLVFIPADGFKGDVLTFESWALTLAEHPMRDFFAKAGFADYPPGYFYVLWFVGHAYKLLVHSDPNWSMLKLFVKLPAILMDLVDAALIFVLVRRSASLARAFGAAALFAFKTATIFNSAYWGQVDSVAAALTLLTILLMYDAATKTGKAATYSLVGAWLAVAAAILMKPPSIVLVPLMLAFMVTTDDRAVQVTRRLATAIGIGGALVLAYLSTLPFHPGWNPIEQFVWLYGRYQYASGVYPYTSVNAFNIYSIVHHMWEPDSQPLSLWGHVVGPPEYVWGILLMLAAVALVVSQYVQRRDPIAFLEAAFILSLGYFVLLTRMHERYVFNALLLAIPLVWYQRRYLIASLGLTLTLFANLCYSLYYLHVMDGKIPDVDPQDLIPWLSHPMALLNFAIFCYAGYIFLGVGDDPLEHIGGATLWQRVANPLRAWFAPLQGATKMLRIDWLIASALSAGSFLSMWIGYKWPNEKIFDEIYYARAAEEYIAHKDIFEYTHPPLTKLIITLSTLMLGDTSLGWRFLNIVVGALMVLVLYWFAKRLLGSTMFATIAAGFLALDGFHYAQSRIATPEITVAFFSILTLYAFYRFWIASQVRVAPEVAPDLKVLLRSDGLWVAAVTLGAVAFAWFVTRGQSNAAHIVAFLYFEIGGYLAVRLSTSLRRPLRTVVSYADGSRYAGGTLETFDGGRAAARGIPAAGESTKLDEKAGLAYADDELRIDYDRGGGALYTTPEGAATFTPDGIMRAGSETIDGRRDGRIWMWILALCGGCLAASKWNGLFDYFVVWLLAVGVATQRFWAPALRALGGARRTALPASWGNPFGFSLDILAASMLFVGATVYLLSYVPYFMLGEGHNLGTLVEMQHDMYAYHCCASTVMISAGAKHPYASSWWQWPFILKPISYYYHDFRVGAALQSRTACCVAEILALPNPAVWWLGLVSVPFMGWIGWRERNKGFLLLFVAYILQWLPWIASPRLAFEYHFFPNLAVICLADAVLLQRVWQLARSGGPVWPRVAVYVYCALAIGAFVFWFPIVSGMHVTWDTWDARMWHDLFGNQWVLGNPSDLAKLAR